MPTAFCKRSMRNSSPKKVRLPSARGRKAADDSDTSLYGWTNAVVAKLLKCDSDEERMEHIRQVAGVSQHDYNYDMKATALIDYHLANLLYALEEELSWKQTQFLMRVMTRLWTEGVSAVQGETPPNFDHIRGNLAESLRPMFAELNGSEDRLTKEQTQKMLRYIDQVFLKPIRLMMFPFYHPVEPSSFVSVRKIFHPVTPDPLSECLEDSTESEYAFPLLPFPRNVSTMALQDMKDLIQRYTDDVIETINKRYDALEQEIARAETLQPNA